MSTSLKARPSASKQRSRIKVRCRGCGKVIIANTAGKTIACPSCDRKIAIPNREAIRRAKQRKRIRQAGANVSGTFGQSRLITVLCWGCLVVGGVAVILPILLGMPRAASGGFIALVMGLFGVIRSYIPILQVSNGQIQLTPYALSTPESIPAADVVRIAFRKNRVVLTTRNGEEVAMMMNTMTKSDRDEAVALLSQATGRPVEYA